MRGWRYLVASMGIICAGVFCAGPDVKAATRAERVLRDFERDLCRSLKLKGCRTKARKPKKATVQSRKVKKPSPASKAQAPQKQKTDTKTLAGTTSAASPSWPVPVPRDKPDAIPPVGLADAVPPLPREKPGKAGEPVPSIAAPKPEAPEIPKTPAAQPAAPSPPASATIIDTAAGAVCRVKLAALGVSFDAVKDVVSSGQCRVAHPVKLASLKLGTGSIDFPDGPTLDCDFAVKFIEWLKDTGAPIAQAQANSPIAKLWTGPGYECRGRNGDASSKISEHGFGNAVDITNLKLADGRMLEVNDALNPLSPAYATLKGLRGSACGYFTTVLGPGANAAHETHFHFDMGKHGRSENYKICE